MGWFLEKLTQTTVTRYDINDKVFKGSGIIFEPTFRPSHLTQ